MDDKLKQSREGETLELKLGAYIGENSELFRVPLAGVKRLVLDLGAVNYINSVGIKNWIQWTWRFPEDVTLVLRRCPPSVVNQINMVAGFLPKNSEIESLFVPYYCDECSKEANVLFNNGEHFFVAREGQKKKVVYPENQGCDKEDCGMEPDILESKYFKFLDPNGE